MNIAVTFASFVHPDSTAVSTSCINVMRSYSSRAFGAVATSRCLLLFIGQSRFKKFLSTVCIQPLFNCGRSLTHYDSLAES